LNLPQLDTGRVYRCNEVEQYIGYQAVTLVR
jgi:hypothetical protein